MQNSDTMSGFPTEGSIVTKGSTVTKDSIVTKAVEEPSSAVSDFPAEGSIVTKGSTVTKGSIVTEAVEEPSSTVTSSGGPSIMTTRPGEFASKVARLEEPNNNVIRPEETSNTVAREGRHKGVPPQVVKGPSVVARKAGGNNTGPRGLSRGCREGRAQLSAVAQVVAQQAVRAVLDAHCAGPSSPQSRGRQPRVSTRD